MLNALADWQEKADPLVPIAVVWNQRHKPSAAKPLWFLLGAEDEPGPLQRASM